MTDFHAPESFYHHCIGDIKEMPDISNEHNHHLVVKTLEAAGKWAEGFNKGDGEVCASYYVEGCTMRSNVVQMVFGEDRDVTTKEEIAKFWSGLASAGFTDVMYLNPRMHVLNDKTVCLRSQWKMNKAQGVIVNETWVMQDDDVMRLAYDEFHAVNIPKPEEKETVDNMITNARAVVDKVVSSWKDRQGVDPHFHDDAVIMHNPIPHPQPKKTSAINDVEHGAVTHRGQNAFVIREGEVVVNEWHWKEDGSSTMWSFYVKDGKVRHVEKIDGEKL